MFILCIAAAAVGVEVPHHKPFYTVPYPDWISPGLLLQVKHSSISFTRFLLSESWIKIKNKMYPETKDKKQEMPYHLCESS